MKKILRDIIRISDLLLTEIEETNFDELFDDMTVWPVEVEDFIS